MIGVHEHLLSKNFHFNKSQYSLGINTSSSKTDINNNDNDNSKQFIYYINSSNIDNSNTNYISFTVIYIKNKHCKVNVSIDKGTTMEFCLITIEEQFECFDQFVSLDGFKIKYLSKVKHPVHSDYLPSTGNVSECIFDDDVLYCDFVSNEIWLKSRINIFTDKTRLHAFSLEFKLHRKQCVSMVINYLLKVAINFFLGDKKYMSDDIGHYVIKNIMFKLNNDSNIFNYKLYSINENNLNKHIDELFSFNGRIAFSVCFVNMENILFKELQLKRKKNHKYKNSTKLRWNEFMEINSYEMLNKIDIYQPEYDYIQKFINNIITNSFYKKNTISNLLYLYNSKDNGNVSNNMKQILVLIPENFDLQVSENDNNNNNNNDLSLSLSLIQGIKTKSKLSSIKSENNMNNNNSNTNNNSLKLNVNEINTSKTTNDKNINQESTLIKEFNFNQLRNTSRYRNLCKEFKTILKEDTFIKLLEKKYPLRFEGNIIEHINMPEFRNFKLLDKNINDYSHLTHDNNNTHGMLNVSTSIIHPNVNKLFKQTIHEITLFIIIGGVVLIILIVLLFFIVN